MHRLSKEAKDNGDACNVHDGKINLSGKEYQAYKNSLMKEEKKDLLEDLAESKNLKEHGVRATNKAVALDTMQTSAQVGRVIIALHLRTAVHGFAMFTCGHPNDSATPSFVESDMASKFFEDTFNCSVWDIVWKFELWSCNHNKTNNCSDIDAVRNQITVLVEDTLWKMTGDKTVTIVHTHGMGIVGWPSSVVMVRPSKMAADAACRILDKLRSGAIHWVALTRSQRAEVVEEVKVLCESGAVKQHKQWSDKNKLCGLRTKKSKATDPNASEDDSEEEPMPVSTPCASNVPMSAPHAPKTPTPAPHAPNTPTPAPRVPNAPASAPHVPNAPTSAPHAPNAPASASHVPNAPASAPHATNAPASAPCTPSTPTSAPQAPTSAARAPIMEVSTAAGQLQTSQAVTLAALHSTSPATSLSNTTTAFTGTLAASSAMPAAFSPTSPAASLSSEAAAITSTSTAAGMMPFRSQLAGNNFNFDFVGMDFSPMPLFLSSTSTSQLGLSTDELTNDGMTMRKSRRLCL
ncbi:hypothetical protein B0H14DRAFT_3445774 [Mycena olivaceomarginata]|nr:hypothetical protein B0H14DRAFT_3445774 [Mycena olivaceomarginata]